MSSVYTILKCHDPGIQYERTSIDGKTWEFVTGNDAVESNGQTEELEAYAFYNRSARYLRIIGNGNELNAWNSITEVEIWGMLDEK